MPKGKPKVSNKTRRGEMNDEDLKILGESLKRLSSLQSIRLNLSEYVIFQDEFIDLCVGAMESQIKV